MKIINNNTLFSLPEIQINSYRWYTILKIIFMISAFTVVAINVLSVNALPQNTTDWDFAIKYCDCELVDDNKEEREELEDEEEHEKESKER